MDDITMLIRLLTATVLGGVIGFERERSHKIAGLRTHSLVALGSALFVLLSLNGFTQFIGHTNFDPSRIVSSILVGIGFIGAGAILRKEGRIVGTTTAASLWIVAAIGATAGLGFFYLAIFATGIAYAILAVLWLVEKNIMHKLQKEKNKPEDVFYED